MRWHARPGTIFNRLRGTARSDWQPVSTRTLLPFLRYWRVGRPFAAIKDHVLLSRATELEAVDADFRRLLTPNRIQSIVGLIPDEWLVTDDPSAGSPVERRRLYAQFLETRLDNSSIFVNAANDARKALV